MLRTLICTHHLHEWAGSELFAIEIFEELRSRGCEVHLFAPFVHPVFAHAAIGDWVKVTNDPAKIRLNDYDLVLVLHQAASRFLHLQDDDAVFGERRPFFAYFHLSPFEPFEAPGLFAQNLLADAIYANSEETRAQLETYGFRDVALFQNPAPHSFCTASEPSTKLANLLSVSSHLPSEVKEAFEILSADGVAIFRVGKPSNARRLNPLDIWEHDAVVAIGKTVQYCFRAQRPVFCYDHFQGPGWINHDFHANARTNFSGRCQREKLRPEVLASRILNGYSDARDWTLRSVDVASDTYKLEEQLEKLLGKVAAHKADPAKSSLAKSINSNGDIRSKLQLENAVYQLVDRAYERQTGVLSPVVLRPLKTTAAAPQIEHRMLRDPSQGHAKIVAAFSYRFDHHLVPDLLENIGDAIHAYVAWDDRAAAADDVFTDETVRQQALFDAARSIGADWLFAVDPDERFEDELASQIGTMTNDHGPVIWAFECREMFSPTQFRTDGFWALRQRARLFPCLLGMEPDQQVFHGRWTRNALRLPTRRSGLNFYHLRMASPTRRQLRRVQYATLDPRRASQSLGYDYLDDERGMALRDIPEGKEFSPPFVDDHGTWSAPGLSMPQDHVPPDPPRVKLSRLKETWAKGGYESAMHLAYDLLKDNPGDQELALWAADSAFRAGHWDTSATLAESVALSDAESLMARLILARSHNALGNSSLAAAALSEAEVLVPDSVFCAQIREDLRPAPERFREPDALWRRWIDGSAEIHEGGRVEKCDLCVVVLSLGAPHELTAAIASLCEQPVVPEIIVVNSNGGDVMSRLAPYADRLRIITTNQRLFAGAARNIGVDASCGKYVSFLAADCTAIPGCIERRLNLHRQGARAVSAHVAPQNGDCVFQNAAAFLLHANRSPGAGVLSNNRYSLSYHRCIFEDFGYFPPGMRVGEDTYLNRKIADHIEIESDAGVVIYHAYSSDMASMERDIQHRSRRRVRSIFFPAVEDEQALRQALDAAHGDRDALAMKALDLRRNAFSEADHHAIQRILAHLLHIERKSSFKEGQKVLEARHLKNMAIDCMSQDPEIAETQIREAIGMVPELLELYRTLASVVLARPAQGGQRQAMEALQRAAAIHPSDAGILSALMDLMLTSDQDLEARKHFETACQFAPRENAIWARHAPLPGAVHRPMRVYSLQRMFFLDPLSEDISKPIAKNYEHAGNTKASNARRKFMTSGL
ncbi:hypothetical protein A8B78_04310 [Jannaschia sp. EhC01]|nr:hypothetical protein A8B78_04310 [Jannaschia sp. EhC01]